MKKMVSMIAAAAMAVMMTVPAFAAVTADQAKDIALRQAGIDPNSISYITCILSAVVICFGPGSSIAYGGIISLILILVIMFMTTQGFQATRMRERADAEEKTE